MPTILNQLNPHIRILDNLISSTEEEFLFVGRKLQEFHKQANEVANLSSAVAGRISGKEMNSIIEGFNGVTAVVEELGGGFSEENSILNSILNNFSQIRDPLVGFEKVVRNLNILCNFIKIETARLGQSNMAFNTLTEDVQRLALLINTKANSLIDKTDILIPSLKQNISLIEDYKSRQEGQSRLIINKIGKSLDTLMQRVNLSADTINVISVKWRQVTANIGEIVESMQFHDITRQRIEHSCAALKELPEKVADLKRDRRFWRRLNFMFNKRNGKKRIISAFHSHVDVLMADTCELQLVQLQKAKEDFVNAVKRIIDNLANVTSFASSMSEEINQITGKKDRAEGSFVLELEQDVGGLRSSVGAFAQIKKDLSAAMNSMTKTAADMSVYVQEMEKISIEMKMLALNASVHAARIGDEGATLGILADTIHQVAAETATMVNIIVTNLKAVVDNSEKLAVMADQESREDDRKTALINDSLEKMLVSLKDIDVEIEEKCPQINQSGKSLAAEIEALIPQINIHNKVEADIEEVESFLKQTISSLSVHKTKSTKHDRAGLLKDLAAHYTMESERETHLSTTGVAQGKPLLEKVSAKKEDDSQIIPAKDESLGDNVELF